MCPALPPEIWWLSFPKRSEQNYEEEGAEEKLKKLRQFLLELEKVE